MRTIKVTGTGQSKLKANVTIVTMALEGLYKDYAETLKHSSEDTAVLKDVLSAFGFGREDLKTLSFSVDPEYEGYQEEGVYKQRFKGYRFHHSLKVEFDSDNDRLGRILYALAHCKVHPEIRLSYTIKDKEAAKNELLAKAVRDARAKALVLTEAAGLALKEIQSVDYSWGEVNFEVRPMNRALAAGKACVAEDACYEMDIVPDDIQVSDSVTVVWEIGS